MSRRGRLASWTLLTGGVALGVAALPAHADERACTLAVTVEGEGLDSSLAPRLLAVARRVGACEAPSWALRVAPGPNRSFVIALWNGKSLETRFATRDEEVEPVASTLLRVALAADAEGAAGGQASPAVSSSAGAADSPSGAPAASATSPRSSSPRPGDAPAVSSPLFVGVAAGPAVSPAGFGGEAGLLIGLQWRHAGVGLVGRLSGQAQAMHSRRALEAAAVGFLGTPIGGSERTWLGAVAEIGVSSQQATGKSDGTQATLNASGLSLGLGPMFTVRVGQRARVGAALVGRWSSASADPATSTTTTEKGNPGVGNGQGAGQGGGKTVTTVAEVPASREAAGALGGVSGAAQLFVSYAF